MGEVHGFGHFFAVNGVQGDEGVLAARHQVFPIRKFNPYVIASPLDHQHQGQLQGPRQHLLVASNFTPARFEFVATLA